MKLKSTRTGVIGWKSLTLVVTVAAIAGTVLLDRALHAQSAADEALSEPAVVTRKSTSEPDEWTVWMSERLATGTPAKDFSLPAVDGSGASRLSDLRGRPVVLVFGSMTCDLLQKDLLRLERLYQTHKGHADFLFVCVSEAGHPLPGFEFLLTSAEGESRRACVARALDMVTLNMPAVLDADGKVEEAYSAWPRRIVAVDAQGRIALDLGRGLGSPWDFDEVSRWLQSH